MAKWSPPEFTYHRYADGTLVAVGEDGKPLACQPDLTTKTVTITHPAVDPDEPPTTATVVVDQWGNQIDEYEIPAYEVHVERDDDTGETVAIAVDAKGQPLPLQPPLLISNWVPPHVDIAQRDGTIATVETYDGPQDFFIHIAKSHTHAERGTPDLEAIAVDAQGVPLAVQPSMTLWTGPDGTQEWRATWSSGESIAPPTYEFPEFSVHLDYPAGALEGRTVSPPMPIAVGVDGKPLAVQPDWQVDPADPTNVAAVMPDGQLRDAPQYEFPAYRVQLEYPAASYRGAAAPVPHPVAVDEAGVPLPIQPVLTVDPNDHGKVFATAGDHTTVRVDVQEPPKDFFVHVESSGLGGAHGGVSHAAVAVDANGQPLPIQPHLVVDPTDPTKVTAHFPDGTTSTPTPLYPPPGEPPDRWPPDEWPPATETGDADELIDLDATVAPDHTATPPDEMAAAQADAVAAEVGDTVAADPTAAPVDDVHAVPPETEQMSAPLGETFDPGDRYAGVEMTAGEVAFDDDLAEGGRVDDLLTAGLDERAPTEARLAAEATEAVTAAAAADAEPTEVAELVTAGLEPDAEESEEAEFEIEEPEWKWQPPDEARAEPEYQLDELDDGVEQEPGYERDEQEPELKWYTPVDEEAEPEAKWFTPVEEASEVIPPIPTPAPIGVREVPVEPLDTIETPPAEPIEAAAIEPIEIVVEPLEATPIREVTAVGEPDDATHRAVEEHEEDEDEESAQT